MSTRMDQLIVWYYAFHIFLIITVFNQLSDIKSFGSKCERTPSQPPHLLTQHQKEKKKHKQTKKHGTCRFLTHWMINLRQRFYFMLFLDIQHFGVELFTSLPYYLDINSHSVVSVLGLCKSLMSIQLFQVFQMKGRIRSNKLPKALGFCVFSCGKDKCLKTL